MMNHTRISRILTLVVVLSSTFHIYSYISLVDLKGLYTCMSREYERFSPAYGALYWLSDYTKNLYDFGYKESPLVKLTRQLFSRQVDGSFDVTQSPLQLAYHFSMIDWGALVGWIDTYKKCMTQPDGKERADQEKELKEKLHRFTGQFLTDSDKNNRNKNIYYNKYSRYNF